MGKRAWFPVVSGPLAPYATGFEVWLRCSVVFIVGDGEQVVSAGSAQPVA